MHLSTSDWNSLIASLPGAHFLQTREWSQVKAQTGWRPIYLIWLPSDRGYRLIHWQPGLQLSDQPVAATLVLQRTLPLAGFAMRLRVLYCPKGPLLDWSNTSLRQVVLADLAQVSRRQGAIFLKIDPDLPVGVGFPGAPDERGDPFGQFVASELAQQGWIFSGEQVQFRNTVLVDLTQEEDALLQLMKQKTRYNVRLAERKGVTIRQGDLADLDLLYRMYAETSLRDGFVIRTPQYYRQTWRTFWNAGLADFLIAEVGAEPLAATIVFRFARKAWYVYGMSRPLHRDKMPNHLLQWEAMRRARLAGCRVYDLWGAPDTLDDNDPLWGVYRFKDGLGGQVVRTLGAWDLPTRPWLYKLYTQLLPRLLQILRRRGKSATRRSLGGI